MKPPDDTKPGTGLTGIDSPGKVTSLTDDALIAFDNLTDLAGNLVSPGVRLGVTGLSRSGKTIFITALVHNLVHGGRLPLFEPFASGRIARAHLTPQPSFDVPRFQYEDHVRKLVEDRLWPESTRAISELRLTVEYESASAWNRMLGAGRLNIDIVDYPGEWVLDLPLLGRSFAQWSRQALALSRDEKRRPLAAEWHRLLATTDPGSPADELRALQLAAAFTAYLRRCREDDTAHSTLPPGRFLMPGDLEGSPALSFSPLDVAGDDKPGKDTLHAMMAARYEAYKSVVVKPFFREHFARLDRQIVLVDVLNAINAGPHAVADLEIALADILACFRPGRGSVLSALFGPRIDRILFAATKADHLHHE
ncbi:MAG: YcjX family protein, partial [Pseudomonadota bacterium]|nr:YcjX family protein [Pseudomonadota bacterium]